MMTNERTRGGHTADFERASVSHSLAYSVRSARSLAHYDGAVIHGEIESLGGQLIKCPTNVAIEDAILPCKAKTTLVHNHNQVQSEACLTG